MWSFINKSEGEGANVEATSSMFKRKTTTSGKNMMSDFEETNFESMLKSLDDDGESRATRLNNFKHLHAYLSALGMLGTVQSSWLRNIIYEQNRCLLDRQNKGDQIYWSILFRIKY